MLYISSTKCLPGALKPLANANSHGERLLIDVMRRIEGSFYSIFL